MELKQLHKKIKQFIDDFEQLAEVCEDHGFKDYFHQTYSRLTELEKLVTRDMPIKCSKCGCEVFTVLRTVKISRVQPSDFQEGQELLGVFGSTKFVYVCFECGLTYSRGTKE